MQLRYVLCASILTTCVSTAIHAEIIHGRVDRVIDGDTLQVITLKVVQNGHDTQVKMTF